MAQLLRKLLDNPAHMGQTGEHAGNELYLSWENAVVKAVERYQIVMDLYKSGAYTEHRSFSDNLLATSGDMMYTITKVNRKLNKGLNSPSRTTRTKKSSSAKKGLKTTKVHRS